MIQTFIVSKYRITWDYALVEEIPVQIRMFAQKKDVPYWCILFLWLKQRGQRYLDSRKLKIEYEYSDEDAEKL